MQRATRRLEAFGHIAVDVGGGRERPNCITLILHKPTETPAAVPPFNDQNPGNCARVSDHKTPANPSLNPGKSVPKPRQLCHPNYKNYNKTSSDHRDTGDSGPRQRAVALGPLDLAPEASKALGNGAASAAEAEPPKPSQPLKALGPLGDREAELRDRLGRERFKVLTMGTVVELTPDGVLVVEALTPSIGNMIRRDYEADLLAFTGAREFKIVIRMPPEPPPLRRMP